MELLHSHEVEAPVPRTEIYSRTQAVSEESLRAWVIRLARPRHFVAEPGENRATAEWLLQTLGDLGYKTRLQGETRNVIAVGKEFDARSPAVLIGAHYDSVPGSPGADDNASAVAALLGCAAALARSSCPAIFVAFNREEEGFLGSCDFVENFLRPGSFQIRCAHILEMVGYASSLPGSQNLPTTLPIQLPNTGDFLGLLANHQSASAMRQVLEFSRAYTPVLPVTGLIVVPGAEHAFPVLARSDHVPFWSRQIPAVMWTDTAEFRNPNYHRASDTPETLNYAFLKQVTQLLTAIVVLSPVLSC